MYLVFRCTCGRVVSQRSDKKTKKCTCGKVLKVNEMRILARVEESKDVPFVIQKLQDDIYHNTGFMRASELNVQSHTNFFSD